MTAERPASRPHRPTDPFHFRSSDGSDLVGDLAIPTDPWAVAVVCHPHPQYGGNRFHPVVGAVHRLLPERGIASLRFDVRRDFDGGAGEQRDTHAALTEAQRVVPDLPILAVGYSFGALMALGASDGCLGVAAVAPPLAMSTMTQAAAPCLLLVPETDQFTDPETARAATSEWSDTSVEVIDGADHFLVGHDREVAERVADFFDSLRR